MTMRLVARCMRFFAVCGLLVLLLPALPVSVAADQPASQTAVSHVGQRVGRTADTQTVTVSVPLKPNDQGALDTFLKNLYDPAAPGFHHFLTPQQFTGRFFAPQARKEVGDFLAGKGLTVDDPGVGALIHATGDAATVSRAFNITLSDYTDASGRTFFANDRTPLLPTAIANATQGVLGLDNADQEQPHVVRPDLDAAAQQARTQEPRYQMGCTSATAIATRYGSYTPNQLATAYNWTQSYANGYRGEGQTVILFEEDDYRDANVAAYQNCFGTSVPVGRVATDGGVPSIGSGEIEVELDIDVVVGMLPKLGRVLVYETPNNTTNATDQYQKIANDFLGLVVSTSWGSCEQNRSATTLNTRNTIFQQMAAQGMSMFASSGDSGSAGCARSNGSTALAVDDPASQPYVTAVGGTQLLTTSSDSRASEANWNDASRKGGATGGGLSAFWPRPAYQTGPGVDNAYSNGKRQVPDVAADASPYSGYTVFIHDTTYCPTLTGNSGAQDCFEPIGGTSASSPLWAAGTTLINQRLGHGVGFLNPTLYTLLPGDVNDPRYAYFDVVNGQGNCNIGSDCAVTSPALYPVTPGYDLTTGVGVFKLNALTNALVPPVITGINPPSVTNQGNTAVSIGGSNFSPNVKVFIDGVQATFSMLPSAMILLVNVPMHAPGMVDVLVVNQAGTSALLKNGLTITGPVIDSITPSNGPITGGIMVTIHGHDLSARDAGTPNAPGPLVPSQVTFGGQNVAMPVPPANTTEITFVTPAHAIGFVDITIKNSLGQVTKTNVFLYQGRNDVAPAPGVAPNPAPATRQNATPVGGPVVVSPGTPRR